MHEKKNGVLLRCITKIHSISNSHPWIHALTLLPSQYLMVDASFQFIFRLKNREEAEVGFTLNYSLKNNAVLNLEASLIRIVFSFTLTHITT